MILEKYERLRLAGKTHRQALQSLGPEGKQSSTALLLRWRNTPKWRRDELARQYGLTRKASLWQRHEADRLCKAGCSPESIACRTGIPVDQLERTFKTNPARAAQWNYRVSSDLRDRRHKTVT